ncbi:hypothetical protein PIB30_019965 [Stylosanthes scabra]|uniref:Uncharacterized protein n=1 Tax=Stylosanthes scabra TaxID=79078 RepID=A0ABU6X6K5_9FABA|nr:hypothetical protein [Stylosanthes scabra]
MECVREMGFGALEHLSTTNMSKQLMMELVDCFNTKDNTMRTTLGTVKLDATKKVFLCSNNSMPLSPKHFPPIVDVDNTSKMNWGRHVCSFLLNGIIDMRRRNLKGVEGCVFALLIIYMHETHFGENSEHEKAWPPWIKYWKGETLQKRIRVEKKDSTGLLYQANQRKGVTKKEKPSGLKIGKKEALEDDPKGKQMLGKRKHVEEESEEESEGDSSESGSQGDSSESKSENGSEPEPDSEETDSEDESTNASSLRKKPTRTRRPLQRQQNAQVTPPARNERKSKKKHEVNAGDEQPPQHENVDAEQRTRRLLQRQQNAQVNPPARNERKSKKKHEVNAVDEQPPQHANVDAEQRTRRLLQRQQNAQVNPPARTERKSKKKDEVNAADEQPPQHANVDAEQRTERRSKQRNDVNAAAATVTQPPQGSDPPQPHTAAAAVTEPLNNSDHPQPDAAPPQHVAAEINPVNPQEVSFFLICSTNKETAPIHEDVQVTTPDSGIEVVQATSAEEELISRELSNNM